MAERPIIFSSAMVRAILEGRKTQTRRVLKPQPDDLVEGQIPAALRIGVGDLLWVRETWCDPIGEREPVYRADQRPVDDAEELRMRRAGIKSDAPWRSPIHMPREFSRITLRVTDVRVQRLQDMNRGDAMEEGCPFPNMAKGPNPLDWFQAAWDSINAGRSGCSWSHNPWVAAISFERADNG